MLLRVVFILIFQTVWTTSDLVCPKCERSLNFKLPETINTTKFECVTANAQYTSCSQRLHIQYFEKNATVLFEATPSADLVLSNTAQIMTNTTMIWLEEIQFYRTIEILCFHTAACKENTIDNIYIEGKLKIIFKHNVLIKCFFFV